MNQTQQMPFYTHQLPQVLPGSAYYLQKMPFHPLSQQFMPNNFLYNFTNQQQIRQIPSPSQFMYLPNLMAQAHPYNQNYNQQIIVIDSDEETDCKNKIQTPSQSSELNKNLQPQPIEPICLIQNVEKQLSNQSCKIIKKKQERKKKQKVIQINKVVENIEAKVAKEIVPEDKILDLDLLEYMGKVYDDTFNQHSLKVIIFKDKWFQDSKETQCRTSKISYQCQQKIKETLEVQQPIYKVQKWHFIFFRDEAVIQNLIEEELKQKKTKVGVHHQVDINEATQGPLEIKLIKRFQTKKISYDQFENLLSKLKLLCQQCNDEDVAQVLNLAHQDYDQACDLIETDESYFQCFFQSKIQSHELQARNALEDESQENLAVISKGV